MRVLRQSGFSLASVVAVGGTASVSQGGGPGYAQLIVRGAGGAGDVDGCRMRRAAACVTVSVDAVMESWRPYLDFRR